MTEETAERPQWENAAVAAEAHLGHCVELLPLLAEARRVANLTAWRHLFQTAVAHAAQAAMVPEVMELLHPVRCHAQELVAGPPAPAQAQAQVQAQEA